MTEIHIIPQPQKITRKDGTFAHNGIPEISGTALFMKEIETFCLQIKNIDWKITAKPQTPTAKSTAPVIFCQHDASILGTESYSILIETQKITLKASHATGLWNALQSLRQLILAGKTESSFEIPCAEITDSPRFSWRGCMLDTSRHFYSTAFIKKLIDIASMYHMNIFHWHLTDDQGWRLPVDGYPALTEIGSWREDRRTTWGEDRLVGGSYTKAEIAEIVQWAKDRHVDIVPEVDLPGHASAILASYPELGCTGGPYLVEDRFGIFEDVLCAGNDKIFDLFDAIFDTLKELFPFNYVHIGGDEVKFNRWEVCPKCHNRLKALSLDHTPQLQSWITVRLVQMLKERGKTAIGWDEVLEGTEKLGLPEDLVVMSWRGQEGGIEASSKGHRVIMTPLSDGCYLNFKPLDNPEEPGHLEVSTVRKSYEMDPISPEMTEKQASLVLGGQCNLWSEVIYASRIAEYMLFPRLCAISESLWSQKSLRSLESFEKRLPTHRKILDALDVCQYRGPLE